MFNNLVSIHAFMGFCTLYSIRHVTFHSFCDGAHQVSPSIDAYRTMKPVKKPGFFTTFVGISICKNDLLVDSKVTSSKNINLSINVSSLGFITCWKGSCKLLVIIQSRTGSEPDKTKHMTA